MKTKNDKTRLKESHSALVSALKQTLDALYNETDNDCLEDSPWIAKTKAMAAKALRDAQDVIDQDK